MRFGRLRLRGFKSYNDVTINLSDLHAACISGDNGTGKSTLVVDAPLWALFGKRHADLDKVVGTDATTARVDLEVITDDAIYLVARERKRGGTTGLSVKRLVDGSWEPVVAGADAAQTFIDEVILNGRGYRELIASVYMVQGNHSVFTRASQADAKAIFMSLLALDKWPKRAEYVAGIRREVQREHDLLAARVAFLSETEPVTDDLPALKKRLSVLVDEISRKSDALYAKGNELAIALKQSERAPSAKMRKDGLHARLDSAWTELNAKNRTLELSAPRFSSIEAAESALAGYDALAEQAREWKSAFASAKAHLEAMNKNLEDAQHEVSRIAAQLDAVSASKDAVCYTCGQAIHDKAKDKVIAGLEAKQVEAAARWRECRDAVSDAESTVERLSRERVEYDREEHEALRAEVSNVRDVIMARKRIAELNDAIADIQKQLAQIDEEHEEVDVASIEQEYAAAHAELRRLETERDELSPLIATLEERESRYKRDMLELSLAEKRLDDLSKRLEVLREAEHAFGRDGIPSYLLETAIPQVEKRANELLSMMSGGSMSVSIATQRLTKTAGVKESLDIVVSDGSGAQRTFDTFSEGEAFRINFSLRVALAELVAQRSGLKLSMLVIDEPEGLDESGRDALVEALAVVTRQFDTIILVSHHSDLKDALPQSVRVSKAGAHSTVTVRS